MPLSVYIPEGGDVIIGNLVFVVSDIRARGSRYRLTEKNAKVAVKEVSFEHPAEFLVGDHLVTVLSTDNRYWYSTKEACLRIAADRSITILRGDLYRKNGARFMVSSDVRAAIAGRQVTIPDVQTLLHLAQTGTLKDGTISAERYVLVLDGIVIVGVAERP